MSQERPIILKRVLPLLWLIPGASACVAGGDAPVEEGVQVDTLGGYVYVINSGDGLWTENGRWQVDTGRVVEIGAVDGAQPYVFGEVAGVVVGESGRIYVADTQAMEVRVFSQKGEFLARFGREGEGPGEFRNISGLGLGADGGVAVLDGRLGRVSVFTEEGAFIRTFRLKRPYMMLLHGGLVRFDGQGRYYDRTRLSHGIGTDTLGVVRYSASGEVEDTTLVAIYEPRNVLVRRGGVPVMSFPVPFAPKASSAVGPNGLIYATRGEAYEIAQLAATGDTLLVIRRTVTAAAVSTAERDSALLQIKKRYREAAGADPRDLPAIPERKPAIAALRVDEMGYLWVLRPSGRVSDTMEWDVFNPEGRFFGTLSLPPMNVMHIGERSIAGVVRDELGVARVTVVSLNRGSGLL